MIIKVSVVIPTYRRPQLLKNCLAALLEQTMTDFEIIVVSDGPDSATADLINNMQAQAPVRYLPLPHKKGPAAARNYGWQNATAEIIAFTDDDCLPESNWLIEIVRAIEGNGNIAITGKVIVPVSYPPTDYEKNTAGLETADFITANCACTKTVLQKAGGFDEQFSMAWREDSDLHFKLLQNEIPIRRLNSAEVIHPVRKSKWGVSVKEQKKTMFDALLYKKYPKLFRKKIRPVSPVLYYAIIVSFLIMLAGIIIHKQLLTITGSITWLTFTVYFICKRLATTSLALDHITEMVATSFVIPFVSVFWQWYGALKYKTWFV
ncbi:glycosyltransferase family 2 protein [Mucilaginibacter sp. KACC 22063]|uniref:glycosyltransferase family 2 protein n=1 Tax=Mucilaginibacter sp. KACC 22063 TaxID=3025666 RepID=UPI0023650A1A|nr:glycosyltransferase family A protein [Mucilaginibacter sp. KACC 22063]WDF54610.1 glycosyltransferase family A protein [Mucilaginibacter sp. KACC 22063]